MGGALVGAMRLLMVLLAIGSCEAGAGLEEIGRRAGGLPERQALAGGGYVEADTIYDRRGAVQFAGYAWAQRYGRFGSPKAMAVSPDGRVAIVNGADSPSACLCDRERGTGGSNDGAVVRIAFVEGRAVERELYAHHGGEIAVAASPTTVAAVDGLTLRVWPASGDAAPVTVKLEAPALRTLAFAGERYLVGSRYVDLDHSELVVLDRAAGWRPVSTISVGGYPRGLAIRPGGDAVAVAFDRYRATDRVLVDERRVAVFGLDGTLRAQVELEGHPLGVAWATASVLEVATSDTRAAEVIRFRYRTR